MTKKRIAVLSLCALLAITPLAGCSGSSDTGSTAPAPESTATAEGSESSQAPAAELDADKDLATEIQFWHCMGGNIGEAVENRVAAFNQSQDQINVVSTYQGGYDDALTKLKAAIQSNTAPDVVQMFELGTRYLVDSGSAIAAQDLIEADPSGSISMDSLEPYLVSYYTVNGKFQCVPFNPSTPILYYNKTAFEEVGLDPEQPPKTFDEILEFSEKLTVMDGDRVVRYGFGLFVYGWFFENMIAGQGELFANNDNGRSAPATEVVFDQNGSGLKAIEMWKQINDSGYALNFGRKGEDSRNAFMAGQAAIILESTAQLTALTDGAGGRFEIGTGYFPRMTENENGGVICGGGNLWVIDSKDEARINSAWEFIKYSSLPEIAAQFSRETGYFCADSRAYDDPDMVQYLEERPNFQTAINQLHDNALNTATQGASLGVFSEIRTLYEQNLENVLQGTMTPQEAVDALAQAANDAIDNYNTTMGL